MFERVARRFSFPVVAVPDSARTREQVVQFLISALAAAGRLAETGIDASVSGVLKREFMGSTALGRGAALPHGLSTAVSVPVGVVGRVPHGVAWAGKAMQPVTAVCLVLAPASGKGLREYMKILEGAVREVAASATE